MRVADLTPKDEGRRIRVLSAAMSRAEELGYVDDSKRLPGMTGTLQEARHIDGITGQAFIEWDQPGCSLMLASEDEVEFIVRVHVTAKGWLSSFDVFEVDVPADTEEGQLDAKALEELDNDRGRWCEAIKERTLDHYEVVDTEVIGDADPS